MPTIEINRHDYSMEFDLPEILTLVEPYVDGLDWYFVEFDPISLLPENKTDNTPTPRWVYDLWHEVQEANHGVRVEWQTLKAFALYVRQTDMALLIGIDRGKNLPPEPLDLNSSEFAIVIQSFDAYMWIITTQNVELPKTTKTQFPQAQSVAQTNRYY